MLAIAERILREAENLKRASAEFATGDSGRLVLAATHTQARYALPVVVRDFVAQHPSVKLEMHQVPDPDRRVGVAGEADIASPPNRSTSIRNWSLQCASGAIA